MHVCFPEVDGLWWVGFGYSCARGICCAGTTLLLRPDHIWILIEGGPQTRKIHFWNYIRVYNVFRTEIFKWRLKQVKRISKNVHVHIFFRKYTYCTFDGELSAGKARLAVCKYFHWTMEKQRLYENLRFTNVCICVWKQSSRVRAI